jgi:hypothetical protein
VRRQRGVEAMFLNRVEQGGRLQPIAREAPSVLFDTAGIDRSLHRCDDQLVTDARHAAVAELDRLWEVVPRIDVHDGEWQGTVSGGTEGLLGDAEQRDRILAGAEQQHWAFELSHYLAHDVDGLGLERTQLRNPSGSRHVAAPALTRSAR